MGFKFNGDVYQWSKPKLAAYWQETLTRRMPLYDEAERLRSVLTHFWVESGSEDPIDQFVVTAKRPFGNKDVLASIVFNLGWDWFRVGSQWEIPEYVQDEAANVLQALMDEYFQGVQHPVVVGWRAYRDGTFE